MYICIKPCNIVYQRLCFYNIKTCLITINKCQTCLAIRSVAADGETPSPIPTCTWKKKSPQ